MSRLSVLLYCSLAIAAFTIPALAQEEAKWFVLRNHQVGNCWTATLIRVDGQYINTFEQKAGGPYDTQERALERQKVLEDQAICSTKTE